MCTKRDGGAKVCTLASCVAGLGLSYNGAPQQQWVGPDLRVGLSTERIHRFDRLFRAMPWGC